MDQKLLRCLTSLREETDAAQRGGSTDIVEIVNDVSSLCDDLVTDEDVSLALAMIFDPSTGIFNVVERLLFSREKNAVKGKENCLVFVSEFIKKTNTRAASYASFIKEQCLYIFQRDESKSVQAAALLPLISLLDLHLHYCVCLDVYLDWSTAKVFMQAYKHAKQSGTLRANILIIFGEMVECFPSHLEEDNVSAILNICLDCLDEQLRQKGKDPSYVLVSGAMKCLDGLLTWFDKSLPAGGSVESARRIYSHVEQVLYFREDLKRYEMVKAALRLLSRHACLFRLRLLEDSLAILKWLEAYCIHINAQLRDAALPAFNEFILQVVIGLSSEDDRVTNAKEIYKRLLAHALGILDGQDQNPKLVSLAIRLVGKLSPVIVCFSGKDVLQRAFQRIIVFGSFSQRLTEVQEETLGFSVTLVSAIADIIKNLDDVDNYVINVITQAVCNIFISFPNLFPRQKPPASLAIKELLLALNSKGAIFSVFLSNIVCFSLQRAIEPNNVVNQVGPDFWKSYTELWSKLIDIDDIKYQPKHEGCEVMEDTPGSEASQQIQRKIVDAMITCTMKLFRELNLKYRVRRAMADKEPSVEDGDEVVLLESDSDNSPIEPLNEKDMKKFLKLVEFIQELLMSKSVPFYAKWVLPFSQCIVELSSSYPLLSGFYKVLSVVINIADSHGYFRKDDNFPSPMCISQVCGWTNEERSICRDLLQQYLREVLIASRRYKLELLAACLRLCLSAPPPLICMQDLVEPIKVALKMGLRYNPLANVAIDALERWMSFNKRELEECLHHVVPCFNDYLTLAATTSELDHHDPSEVIPKNMSMSQKRTKNERKALLQPSAFQLTQTRVQRFLGRTGRYVHFLVPDVDLLQAAGTGGLAWDTTDQIKFILPFMTDKSDIWLDSLLPKIVELALSASNRSTKVSASELLHAICLLMIGNAAKGPSRMRHGENPSVRYDKIYRRVFPAVIQLAADVEQVTRELFSKLVMQVIHWFTSNTQKENPDTMALLDSILEGLVDSENASLREFCSECFEEFMLWSIRNTAPEVDNFTNVTSMLRRLYNRLDHPNPYHRLGSAMACSRLYRIMRDYKSIADKHLLEVIFFCVKSLRIAEADPEQVGTVKQISKVLDVLQRLVKRNISSLMLKRGDRAIFTVMDDFLDWLFKQTRNLQEKCRSKCMYLFSSIYREIHTVGSLSKWIKALTQSRDLEDTLIFLNAKLKFSVSEDSRRSVEMLEQEMRSLTRSLHWYEWGLKMDLVTLEGLASKASNMRNCIKDFCKRMLDSNTSNTSRILTPSELENYEKIRLRTIMYLLSFVKAIIYIGVGVQDDNFQFEDTYNSDTFHYITRLVPVDDSLFIQMLSLLLLSPIELGFKHMQSSLGDDSSRLTVKVMKLLIMCCKDHMLKCLQKLLVERPNLDLGNISFGNEDLKSNGYSGLENERYLLRGYQQLLVSGILLPILGEDKCYSLSERLLLKVSDIKKDCSNVILAFAADMLSLVMSLGMKIERLLRIVFDETPLVNSSLQSDDHLTVGSVFYLNFRKILIQHIKFSYKESLELLLSKANESSTARLVISALLDDYVQASAEGNVITLGSFINAFVNHITCLAPCCRPDAAYVDKLFFLEILSKLLVLDPDTQTVLRSSQPSFQFIVDSYFSCLSLPSKDSVTGDKRSMNLVVQNSALALIPRFLNSANAHLYSQRFVNVMVNIVTKFLLARETDLPPGSTQRAMYFQTLDMLLQAVSSTRSVELLEILFPILQICLPVVESKVLEALKSYALNIGEQRYSACSLCLEILHDENRSLLLKYAVVEKVLLPVLQAASPDFLLDWFAQHITDIVATVSLKPSLEVQQCQEKEGNYLVVKTSYYKMLSHLFIRVDATNIRHRITPQVSNQQLMQISTNDSRGKNDPPVYQFSENVALWRELHIQAYNCLAALVMCTQDQEKIFTILFKDFAGKPLWQQLVDCEKVYTNFPVETSQHGSLRDITRNLRSQRKISTSGASTFLSSQYVMGGTLSQDPSLIDNFISSGTQYEDETNILNGSETEHVKMDDDIIDMDGLDQDDFDQHPCLLTVLQLISHLHSKMKGVNTTEMPEWMKALHSCLSSGGTPINVCLFIIKVVIRARKVFARFGNNWIQPLLQPFLREPERSGGKNFHYMLRDVCTTILEWNLATASDGPLVSRFVNYLLEVAPHASTHVVRANLEIIRHILLKWKDSVTLDIGIIASYLTSGGKTPTSSDKSIITHRIVGLQLLGAMMAAGLSVCEDVNLSEKDLLKCLVSNMTFKVKGVYEASAELLGLILRERKDLHNEQILETNLRQALLGLFREGEVAQFLSILDKITLNFPPFLEGYATMVFDVLPRVHGVFRVLSLSIILRCPDTIPNLFSMILPFLAKLVTHRDEIAQMKSLQLVAELVKDASKETICEHMLPVLTDTFLSHDSAECRKQYYEILIYLYTSKAMDDVELLNRGLLQGLCDDSSIIRQSLQMFWHAQLSKTPRERFVQTISRIYDPVIEGHWIHIACSLLLKLCEESVDFERPVFSAPLSDCEFKEYTLDRSLQSGTLPMTPMFLDTLSGASLSEREGSELGELSHSRRQVGMVRATIPDYGTHDISQSQTLSTFTLGEGSSSLFAFSKKQDRRGEGGEQTTLAAESPFSIRQRLIHPRASRPQIVKSVLNSMKRKEARIAQQAQERENRIQILRRYRIGDLPDIEIKHSEIINLLASIGEHDPTFSRLLLLILYRAVSSISNDKYLDSEFDFKAMVTKAMENALRRSQHTISFVSCALSLCLEDKESSVKPKLVGSISMKSANFQSGILYLENSILRGDVPWQYTGNARKRHKGPRGAVTLEPNELEEAWLELANLYRSIGENDIVLSIYKQHLTKLTLTQHALEAELGGKPVQALKLYDEAIDQYDESDNLLVNPTEVEQNLWYTRRLHCLANILNWRAVMDEILFQVEEVLDKLWEPRAQDSYLRLFIRAAIKMPTYHAKLTEFLTPTNDDDVKKKTISTDFSTHLATLAVSTDQLDRARFYVQQCYKSFVRRWSELHPLATSARHLQVVKLQIIAELNEFIDNIATDQFHRWYSIMPEWRNRWPSPAMDDTEAWDDVVQNRLLFFQKLQSAFNSYSGKGKEEERRKFSCQLDEERACIFYAAARGLMKQGSYEAAKGFMNQFIALQKEKLDFTSYKNIIKLRCLEADRVSDSEQCKAVIMLEQVLSYITSTSAKHHQNLWQCGLKLLEASTSAQLGWLIARATSGGFSDTESTNKCLRLLGASFTAYSLGLNGMNDCRNELSPHRISKSMLKFAFFCDELLKSAEAAKWGHEIQRAVKSGQVPGLPETAEYPRLVVKHILNALRLDSSLKAHHCIARVLTLVGQYNEIRAEFLSAVENIDRSVFISWIPQMLSSLDKDDGDSFVGILEDIAALYPQAIYFSYNVSKLGFGPVGSSRTKRLESILRNPILESLARSLEDLTFPEQRLRDGLSWIKSFLESGNKEAAKEHFNRLADDCLNVECMTNDNRRSGEYNVKFARNYSKRVLDALGEKGMKLTNMNEQQFSQATSAIMTNLQKSLKNLQTGCMSLSSLSKWLADFDQSKSSSLSNEEFMHVGSAPHSLIDMFGSYNSFHHPDPESHVKVVSFDQTIICLGSKQRPKILNVRGSDEREYKFIVKGGEDLRLDQRIEQLFEVMNSILSRDPNCSKRKLCIRTYAVIPVSRQCGLLQFVENTRALDDIIKDGLACVLPSLGLPGKPTPSDVTTNARIKYSEWLSKRGGSQNIVECYKKIYSKVHFSEMSEKMNSIISSVPWDTLRTGLFKLTTSAESFLALRSQYQRSLAVNSICGYVAGVGDRHLANTLIDTKGGSLVPIDFGYSFGTGVIMLPVPELIPFRMTPQLTNVLLPQDAIGLLRNDMIHVMNALHNSKDIISSVMDVFVKEPLVDWKAEAMKTSSFRNDEADNLEGLSIREEQHVALKVEFAHRKLDLWNPAKITVAELQSSVHATKPYLHDLEQIVLGSSDRNIRARIVGDVCKSVQEQVDCLIDQATDLNLLGRIWLGWQPWI